ncbi:2-oxoacid:acceptor oxidoreductase family protein [candidate division KSB1 bacterium]
MNIRFTGFGGQGIVLSGVIYGWAAILDGKNAIQTQSYGSEARGGSCKCDVIIQDSYIHELEPSDIDILIAFSQPAYDTYSPHLRPEGTLFIDEDLVQAGSKKENIYAIPATDLAYKKMNRKIMANIIMLGYLTQKTNIISAGSVEKSIRNYVPAKTIDENLKAFRIGLELP